MYKIVFTLLILFSVTAYGAEVDNALLRKNLEAANLQIEVLKAQVKVMESYQDKFLSTVYWSLGTVGALVVFFAGFNWFTNNRNLEKEAQLQKESIQNELTLIENKLNTKINDSLLEIKKTSKDTFESFEENMENRITAISEKFGNSISTNSSDMKGFINENLDKKINPIIRDLLELKRRSLESDYDNALQNKVYTNCITYASKLLDLTINDYDFQSNTSNALMRIEATLDQAKHEQKLKIIKPQVIANLIESLSPFQEKHSLVINRILQNLSVN